MADDMIVRLAENGGVIMINFGSAFISQAPREYGDLRREAFKAYREANGLESSDALEKTFNASYSEEHGEYPYATTSQVLDHFDRIVMLTSIDNVGIGSDYDGVGDSLPIGLKDVSAYPSLVAGLLDRGYSEADIRKILGGNLLRVWRDVERIAGTL
jgi:membrane dipeptidase